MIASCYQIVLACLLLAAQTILNTQPVLVGAQNTNFRFPYFITTDSFLMFDEIQHDIGSSSFVLNSWGAALNKGGCGKLFYEDQVRMKDSAPGAVASFHTAFSFQIQGPNIYGDATGYLRGDGLAFTFAKNSTFENQSSGESLCLLKSDSNGMASNRLFAVEFDTYYNYGVNDSSNNHIGVNINSMNSTWSYNLCGGSVVNCTYLRNGGYFTAWIDYDSASQKLEVFLANGSLIKNIPKPPNPSINTSLASAVPLSDLVDDYMYVGFSASTGKYGEVHQIQSWWFTSSGMPEVDNVSLRRKIDFIAGVLSAGAVAALLVLGFFIGGCRRRTISDMVPDNLNSVDPNLVPREFASEELRKATKNFSKSEFLGKGGSGKVYKGTLPSGALVAVKQLKHGRKQGEVSFEAEKDSLTHIGRHPNLMHLSGWCEEEEQLFLVYEYMSNGSLDEWLFGYSKRRRNRKGSSNLNKHKTLPLDLRCSVLRGVAAALLYLHEECPRCVLHRDIKSSNVLLDDFWTARLGDFGLARLVTHGPKVEKTTEGGTEGYMAPEMPHTGKATKESDVYSFGVLMLEVMCGTRPHDYTTARDGNLVDRVWRAHEAGDILQVADSRLGTFPPSDSNSMPYGDFDSQEASHISNHHARDAATKDKKSITNLLHLGLLCCNLNPEDRPSMHVVSQLLRSSEDMEILMLPLPLRKPDAHYGEGAHNRI